MRYESKREILDVSIRDINKKEERIYRQEIEKAAKRRACGDVVKLLKKGLGVKFKLYTLQYRIANHGGSNLYS